MFWRRSRTPSCGVRGVDIAALYSQHQGDGYELYARHSNNQLEAVDFDVGFCRGKGQYLYDGNGTRYLDLLSGFGVFAIGRNHPMVRAALQSVLNGNLPNLIQMDAPRLAAILAKRLLERVPYLDKVLFPNSGAEAVEAVIMASTFAENDMAMAASIATIEVLASERLIERAASTGERLMRALSG